ncbi:MAG: hypothetical protein R2717_07750 [Schumannella sp.]
MSGRAGWLRVGAAVVAGELRHDQAVRIQDGRIAEIAAGGAAPADARHAPNATLIPGFVDAHCHQLSATPRPRDRAPDRRGC